MQDSWRRQADLGMLKWNKNDRKRKMYIAAQKRAHVQQVKGALDMQDK